LAGRPSSSRPPKNIAKLASIEIAPAMVALMVEIRMSRWATWASSCAITPRSSRSVSTRMMPVVAATAACSGLRPVAKAFGRRLVDDVDARHRQAGLGRQLAHHRIELRRRGRVDLRALYIFSTSLSENQ
jgi:hypothetical protein